MIIDAHAHISNSTYGNVDLYLDQLDESGVNQGIVVPGGTLDVRKMTEYIMGRSEPENPVPDNAYVRQACNTHNQLLGFMCIDPHEHNAAEKLQEGFNNGFRGLKLTPMTHQFSFASEAVAELASLCGNHDYPVYSHVVYNPGASTSRFIALAKKYPQTNFILGHMGFGPADVEGLDAACELDNLFLETSTGSFLHLKEAVSKAGPSKIIYGSEFPLSHPKVELEKILYLNLKDNALEKILGENIKMLLQLEVS